MGPELMKPKSVQCAAARIVASSTRTRFLLYIERVCGWITNEQVGRSGKMDSQARLTSSDGDQVAEARPIILLTSRDRETRDLLDREIRKRYGSDYAILTQENPESASTEL